MLLKTTELMQLFQYTTTLSLMIFNVYVHMNNTITRKIERLRALITLAVCTRPNFRRFVPLRFCVAKIWPGTRLLDSMMRRSVQMAFGSVSGCLAHGQHCPGWKLLSLAAAYTSTHIESLCGLCPCTGNKTHLHCPAALAL